MTLREVHRAWLLLLHDMLIFFECAVLIVGCVVYRLDLKYRYLSIYAWFHLRVLAFDIAITGILFIRFTNTRKIDNLTLLLHLRRERNMNRYQMCCRPIARDAVPADCCRVCRADDACRLCL
jgi:hypothetical protein